MWIIRRIHSFYKKKNKLDLHESQGETSPQNRSLSSPRRTAIPRALFDATAYQVDVAIPYFIEVS